MILRLVVKVLHALAHPQSTRTGVIRLTLSRLLQTLNVTVDVAAYVEGLVEILDTGKR